MVLSKLVLVFERYDSELFSRTAKLCRWCLSNDDALDALTSGDAGQYKEQEYSQEIESSLGVPSDLCSMCEARLKKMDLFLWRCNENNVLVDKFIKQQNTVKNETEILQDHLDHSGEQMVGSPLSIETEVFSPDTGKDVHLNQRCCTVHQTNRTYECCGNQPFEAEENPITIKLEYVDVDEQYRLGTNALLDHEPDDLQTNPLELLGQDREDHSISKNMCADGTKLSIKTEVTTSDETTDLHWNQKSCTVRQANRTYECCGKLPDDLFEAEENPIAIKSEYEEDDEKHQLQMSQETQVASHRKKQKHHCPHCPATYPALSKLKIHIRSHTGERPYQCKVCDKSFYSTNSLTEHSKIHNKDQHHQCPHCTLMFAQLHSLKVHIRTHTGERPYQCKVCDKAFYASGLNVHIRTHTGERPYQCKVCGNAFKTSGHLAEHSKIHNKDLQHKCPYCSSKFAQTTKLKVHIRTHTGERPYKCKICDKAFHSSGNLAAHSKIHNEDQQYQCPYCSSKFAQFYKLRFHIRTHTDENPYKCKFCDKAFTKSTNLAQHSKIHKKDKPY
ncbi:zinc finger protein 260-like isoform X2 [Anopheles bellator]|uniref:zinc finger protein 260-like isoform X2 n=1 Tax=Anopheles bellator TaxID=139047 RepID=UPI0026491608|nr:zinc finger protein 260-like isoform X2 [Anopheles bellator]